MNDESNATPASDAEVERMLALIERGLSPCCEAALDTSRVVKSGGRVLCGDRFCSKCRKHVYTV